MDSLFFVANDSKNGMILGFFIEKILLMSFNWHPGKVIIACSIVIGLYILFGVSFERTYKVYSPDRQYSVYARPYMRGYFTIAMPGGGSDKAGRVYLFDEIEQHVIATGETPMLWTIGDIQWDENIAYFRGDFIEPNILNPWNLPRKIRLN